MLIRLLRALLPAVLAGTVGLQLAHADIYTWVDASGAVNVSNLAPPDSVHVTSVIHASATAARDAAVHDAAQQAEVRALADRVRQLEDEVQVASYPAPPRVEYRAVPPPPMVQYIINQAPPPVQYPVAAAPSAYGGCDPMAIECGFWQGPVFYPSVIFVRSPNFRRTPPFHDGHQFAVHQPMRPPPGIVRRG